MDLPGTICVHYPGLRGSTLIVENSTQIIGVIGVTDYWGQTLNFRDLTA